MATQISGTTGISAPAVNVAGNITGNVVGNLTGNVVGNLTGTAIAATSAVPASNLSLITCKAWLNFRGNDTYTNVTISGASGGTTISVTAGSDIGTWTQPTGSFHDPALGGMRFIIPTIGGISGTLGGVNVAGGVDNVNNQCQFLNILPGTPSIATFKLLGGPAQTSQTINSSTTTIVYRALGIRESFNISYIERASANAGDYRIYFRTPMTNPYYLVTGTTNLGNAAANWSSGQGFDTSVWDRILTFPFGELPTVNSFRIRTGFTGVGTGENHVWTSIAVFGI